MMGRAGRPQYDQHGKAVILVHEPKKSFYKKVCWAANWWVEILVYRVAYMIPFMALQFLYEPFPVESNLREHLHDHINAEIVSRTICHKEDAVHYLTWTYLFRRLVGFSDKLIIFECRTSNTLGFLLNHMWCWLIIMLTSWVFISQSFKWNLILRSAKYSLKDQINVGIICRQHMFVDQSDCFWWLQLVIW